jgi:Cof subfamily protein (haloacid dehalogenase superfamily)
MMPASESIVYVTDLDGTLLTGSARLSPRTRAGLSGLLDDGLPLSIATARSVVAVRTILDGLSLPLPVVEFGGALVSELTTGHHLLINAIAPDAVEVIYEMVLSAGCLPFVSAFDGIADRLYYSGIRNEGMQWYLDDRVANHDPRVTRVEDLSGRLSDQIVCLTVIDRRAPLVALMGSLAARFGDALYMREFESIYSHGWHWLTIYDARATKDQGVASMLRVAGLDGAEVVVFGDSDGDIPMFRAADRSIAVANATDGLLALATEVIGPNTEDSVVKFLELDWRGHGRRLGRERR